MTSKSTVCLQLFHKTKAMNYKITQMTLYFRLIQGEVKIHARMSNSLFLLKINSLYLAGKAKSLEKVTIFEKKPFSILLT